MKRKGERKREEGRGGLKNEAMGLHTYTVRYKSGNECRERMVTKQQGRWPCVQRRDSHVCVCVCVFVCVCVCVFVCVCVCVCV